MTLDTMARLLVIVVAWSPWEFHFDEGSPWVRPGGHLWRAPTRARSYFLDGGHLHGRAGRTSTH